MCNGKRGTGKLCKKYMTLGTLVYKNSMMMYINNGDDLESLNEANLLI